jgi:hypothetical protein
MSKSLYPTVSFRLDARAYETLGFSAAQKGLNPNAFAKLALCKALAATLREMAAESEAAAQPSSLLLQPGPADGLGLTQEAA